MAEPFDQFEEALKSTYWTAYDASTRGGSGSVIAAGQGLMAVLARISAACQTQPTDERWWGWNFSLNQWFPCLEQEFRESVSPEGVIVQSDIADRDRRRDELIAAVNTRLSSARQPQPTMSIIDMDDDDPQLELHGLASTFIDAYCEASEAKVHLNGIMAGMRAVRAALAPVPQVQIPEGWHLVQILNRHEGDYVATIESGFLGEKHFRSRSGFGSTWQEALAAACEKAGGGE